MITFRINENKNNEHCYQVNGTLNANGKDVATRYIIWADSEKDAKAGLKDFQLVRRVKYNLQTLADAQKAYKKKFGSDVELDSVEFLNFVK